MNTPQPCHTMHFTTKRDADAWNKARLGGKRVAYECACGAWHLGRVG